MFSSQRPTQFGQQRNVLRCLLGVPQLQVELQSAIPLNEDETETRRSLVSMCAQREHCSLSPYSLRVRLLNTAAETPGTTAQMSTPVSVDGECAPVNH